MSALARTDYEALDDVALAGLIAARDREAVRLVTQRNNQRLYRAAWSILRNRAEAEEAVQPIFVPLPGSPASRGVPRFRPG